MLKHMLLFRVESESEPILVQQVLEESPVVTGFDNSGADPEPEIVNEGEHVVVNQVAEEANPSIEVGSNICGTSQEPDFSVNEGKPRMHLTLPCVL